MAFLMKQLGENSRRLDYYLWNKKQNKKLGSVFFCEGVGILAKIKK